MKKLLSLPPNLVSYFHQIENVFADEFFCTNDPVGQKLGSGGGTTWLLQACHQAEASDVDFFSWLSSEKRILLHAGGQSRRLPSYAPSGKILTPIPVFRWSRGQRIERPPVPVSSRRPSTARIRRLRARPATSASREKRI